MKFNINVRAKSNCVAQSVYVCHKNISCSYLVNQYCFFVSFHTTDLYARQLQQETKREQEKCNSLEDFWLVGQIPYESIWTIENVSF